MPHGRVEADTTINAGCMRSGTAVNIVPDRAEVEIEVRSHDLSHLDLLVQEIERVFLRAAAARNSVVEVQVQEAFPLMKVDPKSPVARRLLQQQRR